MKTILVPTDFSNNANNAIDYAIALAKGEKARLILVNAYVIPYPSSTFPDMFIKDEIKHTEQRSNYHLRMRSEIIKEKEGIQCEYVSRFGEPANVILEVAAQKKPDLIVMGTHGATGLKAVFMGSNTAKVIGKSKYPVIAVPALAKFKEIKNIVYTTDFHSSDILALQRLLDMTKQFKPRIAITNIYDGDFAEVPKKRLVKLQERIEKKISYKDISYKLIQTINITDTLKKISTSSTTDLLVMSTHPRSLLDKLMLRSLSKRIAYQTKVPLLVLQHKEAPQVIV